jgi:cyclophilin family peptidyl-prolyl cis-trans isomerase
MRRIAVALFLLTIGLAIGQTGAATQTVPWLTITVKDLGKVVVELFPDVAPLNVKNVETLAAKGFYNGLTFHRIVPGFVIQGGDPTGTGAGGPEYTVPAEIKLKHVRGGFAMARTNNPAKASSSCQFYINLNDLPQLDNNYTVIGQVREGLDVVDKIAAVSTGEGDKPVTPVVMEKVVVEQRPAPAGQAPEVKTESPARHFLLLKIKDYGQLKVELFNDAAPNNVAAIEAMAAKGGYDDIPLVAVLPGFVIQCGDVGSVRGCRGECQPCGPEPGRKHVTGALGVGKAATLKAPVRSCEFYFCLADQPRLDSAGFTVIGQTVEGLDILQKLSKVKTDKDGKPVKPVIVEKVEVKTVEPAKPAGTLPTAKFMNLEVKNFGKVKIELFPGDAPRNVANVESLARKGFYDGLTFHRVIPGFVIQGGDPNGDGTGGPDYTVPAEIKRKHVRGAVAMARLGDAMNPGRASSSCQFYIGLNALPNLDAGGYTVIGQVVEGMDVVDKIAKVTTGEMDKPVTPVVMSKVFITDK